MKQISVLLASFSVVMCLVLSYFLIFTELMRDRLYGTNRQILVAILLFYCVFRIFRIYKLIKNKQNEPEV
ncbi:MAG: hypothetical protein K0R65_898 [Crocinitomicaceae bacterium]|jgi:hypothetical protein|nr:hypothetical protein [Crocinitomicaceae bacterium]